MHLKEVFMSAVGQNTLLSTLPLHWQDSLALASYDIEIQIEISAPR